MMSLFQKYWTSTVEIYPLITFRILFGLVTFIITIRFMLLGWINDQYILPKIHFTYFGFAWVEPFGTVGMYSVFTLLLLCSIFIILGAWYRIAIVTFFLLFTYVEFIDVSYYLNHYYFVSLVAGIMCFLPANKALSFDCIRNPSIVQSNIPRWCIDILYFQISCVYFFAGIAKINSDWLLNAQPLRIWLPAHDNIPIIGWLFRYSITPYFASWFGMVFDCCTPFLLLWNRSRIVAYFFVVCFHIVTGILFQIGVFPIVMIALTTVFFANEIHQKILNKIAKFLPFTFEQQIVRLSSVSHFTKVVLSLFIAIQLFLPFRYLFYNGNLFWTEQGYRFSWRVMLIEKAGTSTFFVQDGLNGKKGFVDNTLFLNAHQEKQMSFQPDMILQYSHFLKKYYFENGVHNPVVTAEIYVTLNGRPSQLFIDSTVNLATIEDSFSEKKWILPFFDTNRKK